MTPLHPTAAWSAVAMDRSACSELQAFYEANPEYWQLVYGRPPVADEAEREFDAKPPADMPYSELQTWLIRAQPSQRIVGEVSVAIDLLAVGVMHLGYFMVETSRHGSGLASEVYLAYEHWAIARGSRWLRLGVVEINRRAHAFWRRMGYLELRRRSGYVLGDVEHTLIVMLKPVGGNTIADYLAVVARDGPGD